MKPGVNSPRKNVHEKLHRALEQTPCPAAQAGDQIQRLGEGIETGRIAQYEAAQGMVPDDGVVHHVAAGADGGEQVSRRCFAVEGGAEPQDHGVGGGARPAEADREGDLAVRHRLRARRRAGRPIIGVHRPLPSSQPRLKR